ncbi:hypothetical protein AB0H83_28440 [Dactylosporangium sp. NPDC050688]|uniref:hypothetical protein n=1 Tax=Dactylosporangium sp. NPDC050688 TaxID=3157217 RepID=UPI0033D0D20B
MATTTFEAVRAEALFVSYLQCSQAPKSDEVRAAVVSTLRRVGIKGCAAQVAGEFGDHPETAVARMAWALALVRSTYPARRNAPRAVRLLARSA